jgi:hypothetical protein
MRPCESGRRFIITLIEGFVMDGFLNKIGLTLGEFELHLDRHDWHAGEKVVGEFRFRLKKIVRAKAVLVGIRGYHGKLTPENEPHYQFEMPLAGEGKYHEGSYRFELLIPEDAVGPGGVLGQIGRAVQFVKRPSALPKKKMKWEVWGRLAIPMQASPCRTLQITVSPPGDKPRGKAAPRKSNFSNYQPPPLPTRKSQPVEPPVAPDPVLAEVKVDDESVDTVVKSAEKTIEERAAEKKKRRELRQQAPPVREKPSRLKLPEPSYDDLPRRE